MTEITPLDSAHAAMQAAPDDDTARLRFYERLADGELFVLLSQEAADDVVTDIHPIACADKSSSHVQVTTVSFHSRN